MLAHVAIQFHETITLGSIIISVLVSFAVLFGIIYGARWKTSAEVERANAIAWESAATRLQADLDKATSQLIELRSRPDLTQLAEISERMMREQESHEQRAAQRAERHELRAAQRHEKIIQAFDGVIVKLNGH